MEQMSLVVRVFHFETVASRLDVLVGGNLISRNVDISLDFGLLNPKVSPVTSEKLQKLARTVASLLPIQ